MATLPGEPCPPVLRLRPSASRNVPKAGSLVTVPADEIDGELELRDYLLVLRRRRVIVVLTVAVVVGVAFVLSYIQTPVYAATAKLRIEPRAGISVFDTTNDQASGFSQFIPTEIEVLKGEPVQDIVREKLKSAPPVAVRQVGTTAVVQIVAQSTNPRQAAAVANAYADAYKEHRRQQGINEALAAQGEVKSKIDDLGVEIADLDRQIGPDPGPGEALLQAQRELLLEQQSLFQDNLNRQQINTELINGGAEVVRSAAVPSTPIKPTPLRNAILALVVGALLGVGLAFLVEYLDDSIPTQETLQQVTGAVPVIGLIPEVPGWKTKEKSRLVAMESPRSVPAEAYRALRTAIDFIGLDHPMRTLQVTSPGQGEGKTTTLANLGITLATAGKRVVIVCCDLRRPRIHEFFGLDNTVGFTSTLLGERPVSAALQNVPGVPRLRLLASGPLPAQPVGAVVVAADGRRVRRPRGRRRHRAHRRSSGAPRHRRPGAVPARRRHPHGLLGRHHHPQGGGGGHGQGAAGRRSGDRCRAQRCEGGERLRVRRLRLPLRSATRRRPERGRRHSGPVAQRGPTGTEASRSTGDPVQVCPTSRRGIGRFRGMVRGVRMSDPGRL